MLHFNNNTYTNQKRKKITYIFDKIILTFKTCHEVKKKNCLRRLKIRGSQYFFIAVHFMSFFYTPFMRNHLRWSVFCVTLDFLKIILKSSQRSRKAAKVLLDQRKTKICSVLHVIKSWRVFRKAFSQYAIVFNTFRYYLTLDIIIQVL